MILKDRVAIVTGAGSGIGRAGAMIMAREGAEVVVFDRNVASAEETVAIIAGRGGKASAVEIDVTDDGALKDAIGCVHARHGRIDILHNHAGAQVEGTLEDVSLDGFDARISTCVRQYRLFSGLYDFDVTVVGIDDPAKALVSRLALQGVSFESGKKTMERYLGALQWRP